MTVDCERVKWNFILIKSLFLKITLIPHWGFNSPKLASRLFQQSVLRYSAACCGEVLYRPVLTISPVSINLKVMFGLKGRIRAADILILLGVIANIFVIAAIAYYFLGWAFQASPDSGLKEAALLYPLTPSLYKPWCLSLIPQVFSLPLYQVASSRNLIGNPWKDC